MCLRDTYVISYTDLLVFFGSIFIFFCNFKSPFEARLRQFHFGANFPAFTNWTAPFLVVTVQPNLTPEDPTAQKAFVNMRCNCMDHPTVCSQFDAPMAALSTALAFKKVSGTPSCRRSPCHVGTSNRYAALGPITLLKKRRKKSKSKNYE
jgi:hypothetical protein